MCYACHVRALLGGEAGSDKILRALLLGGALVAMESKIYTALGLSGQVFSVSGQTGCWCCFPSVLADFSYLAPSGCKVTLTRN
jgi:hypothetical protein